MSVEPIGIVLSGTTPSKAVAQIFDKYGDLVETGMMFKITRDTCSEFSDTVLARVTGVKKTHQLMETTSMLEGVRGSADLYTSYRSVMKSPGLEHTYAFLQLLNRIVVSGSGIALRSVTKPPSPGSLVCPITVEDMVKIVNYGDRPENVYEHPYIDKINSRVLIGFGELYGYRELSGGTAPFIIDINNLTMHVAVIGTTGSGKSYTTGYLIEQLSRAYYRNGRHYGVPTLVFDANGDYLDYVMRETGARESPLKGYRRLYYLYITEPKAIEIFLRDDVEERPILIDMSIFEPNELASMVLALYKGGTAEESILQYNLLTNIFRIIRNNIARYVGRLESPGSRRVLNTFIRENIPLILIKHYTSLLGEKNSSGTYGSRERRFIADVEEEITQKIGFSVAGLGSALRSTASEAYGVLRHTHKATLMAVQRALEEFGRKLVTRNYKLVPKTPDELEASISNEFIEHITDPSEPGFVLIDFSPEGAAGISLYVKQFIVYAVLRALYSYFTQAKIRGRMRLLSIVIEEAQNYAPNQLVYPIPYSVARNILALISTQGRKFGMSLIIVTQRPRYVDPIVMAMCNTWIIHRISPADTKYVLDVSGGLPGDMRSKLVRLEKGTAIVLGQMSTLPFPVLVSFHGRRRASHKAGSFFITSYFEQGEGVA